MPVDENTQTLLISWRSGNREAGNRLLARYVPELRGFFVKRSGGNAEELVQRTLVACAQGVGRFEGRSTFRTYLYGIAHRQYMMHRRAETYATQEPVTLPTSREDGPSQLAAVRQEHVALVMALRRVEPEFSVVLRKFYWEDRSLEEIAEELGIAVGTVKSRLARGRAALKEHLTKTGLRDALRKDALDELSKWFATRAE
jgi:RNA polymerase sigma-70 factor (ECF subfamily)